MSQKNETTVLVLALLITAVLAAGGFWWFSKNSGLGGPISSKPNNPSPGNNNSSPTPSPTPGSSTSSGFTGVQNVPTGLFNYGGSTSWAPIRKVVDPAIGAARPEFRLRYVQPTGDPGSSTGIRMLLDGQLAFAQSSRPLLEQEYIQAKQRGFSLQQTPVAIDGLAVAVNPSLSVSGLTLDQLKSIYTGKTTNWNQVGGPNVAIKPYSRPKGDGGTVEVFTQDILENQPFGPNVEFISTTTQALQKLASNPGGIYYASAPEVVPQCTIKPLALGRKSNELIASYREPYVTQPQCRSKPNQLNTNAFQSGQYPITRNLFVIIKQDGRSDQQAGEAYANFLLTEQGQQLTSQAGFVRLR